MLNHNTQKYLGCLRRVDRRKKSFSSLHCQANRKESWQVMQGHCQSSQEVVSNLAMEKCWSKLCPLQIRHSACVDIFFGKFEASAALQENISHLDKVKANHSPNHHHHHPPTPFGNRSDVCIICDGPQASVQWYFHGSYSGVQVIFKGSRLPIK